MGWHINAQPVDTSMKEKASFCGSLGETGALSKFSFLASIAPFAITRSIPSTCGRLAIVDQPSQCSGSRDGYAWDHGCHDVHRQA